VFAATPESRVPQSRNSGASKIFASESAIRHTGRPIHAIRIGIVTYLPIHAEQMTGTDHNKILAIGFAAFAVIYFFTFVLLLVITTGVFVALGITFANESGDSKQAGIGILGGVFTIIFYGVLLLICVLPTALASSKMFKRKPRARFWGVPAAIVVAPIFPLGTVLGAYGLWFLFSGQGKSFYARFSEKSGPS
jgi:magnesium-transporting ATPase (P-type)